MPHMELTVRGCLATLICSNAGIEKEWERERGRKGAGRDNTDQQALVLSRFENSLFPFPFWFPFQAVLCSSRIDVTLIDAAFYALNNNLNNQTQTHMHTHRHTLNHTTCTFGKPQQCLASWAWLRYLTARLYTTFINHTKAKHVENFI